MVASAPRLGAAVVEDGLPLEPRACLGRLYSDPSRPSCSTDQVAQVRGCGSLAHAVGWLRRDLVRSQTALPDVPEYLQQTREAQWLLGQMWLRRGDAALAFSLLRPDRNGWSESPYVVWDLAVAATIVGANEVAQDAYQRALRGEIRDERACLAMRLELAALQTRGTDLSAAAQISAGIAVSDTDPDTCIWASAMGILIRRLDGIDERGPVWPCSSEERWFRYLESSDGQATVYAEVPPPSSWLRIPRNERMALVAIGLGNSRRDLRRRLWSSVQAPRASLLSELKHRELTGLSKEGR